MPKKILPVRDLGDRLRSLLGEMARGGMGEFARRAGITPQKLSNALAGRVCSTDTLARIAAARGVTMDHILGVKPGKTRPMPSPEWLQTLDRRDVALLQRVAGALLQNPIARQHIELMLKEATGKGVKP